MSSDGTFHYNGSSNDVKLLVNNKTRDPIEEQPLCSDSEKASLLSQRKQDISPEDATDDEKDTIITKSVIGLFDLFKYSDGTDKLLIALGVILSLVNGIVMPTIIIILGKMVNQFVGLALYKDRQIYGRNSTISHAIDFETMMQNTRFLTIMFVCLGLAVWIASYGQMACWGTSSERQARKIRLKLLNKLLRMHIGWFDTNNISEMNSRLSEDISKIKEGIGDKLGQFLYYTAMSLTEFVIAFIFGWKLSLVLLFVCPVMIFSAILLSKLLAVMTQKELKEYAQAGSVAEEVISAIRTVTAFSGQEIEINRYTSKLDAAMNFGIKKKFFKNLGSGFYWFIMTSSYALAFWYGSALVREEPALYDTGTVLLIFFCMIFGSFCFGTAAPNLQAVAEARGAATSVFYMIEQKTEIDSFSEDGIRTSTAFGAIEFCSVFFQYPSRASVKVLDNLNLTIKAGEKVALVGPSGCGKSTVVQMIQRFYDPTKGKITFDGHDLRDLNVQWLREKIGVVSQEPVLFDTTVLENLKLGRPDVSDDELKRATHQANCHDFIMELPNKYETLVGEKGIQLSGGQKQRIAIARALIRNPVLLLLDEATSALDNESESVVQEALDKACEGRTTLIIAHRLSTIHGADRIIALNGGGIVEEGTHSELLQKEGLYSQLVKAQLRADKLKSDDENIFTEISDEVITQKSSKVDVVINEVTSDSKKMKKKNKDEVDMKRIIRLNLPEAKYIVIGVLAALINGGVEPTFAVILSKALLKFHMWDQIMKFCIAFIGLALIHLIAFPVKGYATGNAGERLTRRIRHLCFKSILYQDISWFDRPENNTGSLCTQLAVDASHVQGATIRIVVLLEQIGCMTAAVVIAVSHEWATALLVLVLVPLLITSSYVQMLVMYRSSLSNMQQLEDCAKVASESLQNIRTIVSLTREKWFYNKYESKFDGPYRTSLRVTHLIGVAFGFSHGILFFVYSTAFYFGAWRVSQGMAESEQILIVFFAIVFGAMRVGQESSFAQDYGKAKASAANILMLLDSKPTINVDWTMGIIPEEKVVTSSVTFNNVKFEYPSREEVRALNGLDLFVNPGETIALVGTSGCGKSTVVSLIERFYDPTEGSINLSGFELPTLNVKWLRSQIGIVSQEPVLFDRSIRDNIAYGDSSRDVPFDEVIAAARNANIHSFIDSLPIKYDTNVGSKGTQLSGGQKQRVAIARALIRNPKILLLDEATSALDTESEKVVQEAIEKASEGRTCIVVAHRLATVVNADRIYVIHQGEVSESGTHTQLLSNKKFYYKLHQTSIS